MELERYKTIVKEILSNRLEFLKKLDFSKLKEKLNFKNLPVFKDKKEEIELEFDNIMNSKDVTGFIDKIIIKLNIEDTEDMTLLINTVSHTVMESFRESCKDLFNTKNYIDKICPFCGNSFKYGYIDDDGKKFLVCSVCNLGWRFPRIKCPYCETEEQKKLSYIEFENNDFVRFYECENCRNYYKVFVLEKMKNFDSIEEADIETKLLDISYENRLD